MEDNEFSELRKVLEAACAEAIPAAEDAMAKVYQQSAINAAPINSGANPRSKYFNAGSAASAGQLRESIKIIKGKNRAAIFASGERRRIFVGPERKKGYYGYFLEKGWISVGSRRRKRKATSTTHSQHGVEGGRKIPARPWFEPAMRAADDAAAEAAVAAFWEKVDQLDKG
jgi:hypothetical protein